MDKLRRMHFILIGCGLVLGLIILSPLPHAPARAEAGGLAHLEAGWGAVSPQTLTPNPAAQPGPADSQGQELAITLATGAISLAIVVYLVVRRYRRVDVDEDEVEKEKPEGEQE